MNNNLTNLGINNNLSTKDVTNLSNVINLNSMQENRINFNNKNKRLEVGRLNIEKIRKEDSNFLEAKDKQTIDKKSHRKTPSAFEINPIILTESQLDVRNSSRSKHQRNRSQVDTLEAMLNENNKAENSSFIVKNTNEISLINFLNKESSQYENSNINKSLVIPNLLNLQGLNSLIQDNQSVVYNTERGAKEKTIKNILDEFYRKPAATNRSDRTKTSGIFSLKDKDSEKLKIFSGPVDFNCMSNLSPIEILEKVSEFLMKKKISYVQTNPYKLRCSKNGISFDVEVFKLEDSEMHYIKFKLNQGGEYTNYRKLIQIMIENIKLCV
jgi:hypothetical protein